MPASEHPETNIHFLFGCLYRNWMWSEGLVLDVADVETDANILYTQLRKDCAVIGLELDEDSIRVDLKTIRNSCKAIDEAIDRLRERDKKVLDAAR